MDASARRMCVYAAYASAYRTAGISSKAATALAKARAAGAASRNPAARQVSTAGGARMSAWCTAHVPDVTPPRIRKPTPRPTKTRAPEPPEEDTGGRTVHPGAFCSPAGATGTSRGRVHTCKGPGQPRWRR
ncbi:hypothetical protein ACQEU3_17560 [Spirillospora sp. CA-253888]